MKKKQLNLEELKVKSFVTKMSDEKEKTVVGGFLSIGRECTNQNECPSRERFTKGIFCRRP